jgi:transposase InsO family protein
MRPLSLSINTNRWVMCLRINPPDMPQPNGPAGLLETQGIAASMSRVGNPYDNAKAECFIRTLESEAIDGTRYRDHRDAAGHIGAFIDQVYNRQRLHSALGYQGLVTGIGIERGGWAGYYEPWLSFPIPAIAFRSRSAPP